MEMIHRQRAQRRPTSPLPDRETLVVAPPDLTLFECTKRSLSLTVRGCSRLWASANGPKPPEPHEGRAVCRGCVLGEWHATGREPDPAAAVRESLRRLCSRCGRSAERLINVHTPGHCISCYNRHREVLRGENAKHNVPVLTYLLHTEQAQVASVSAPPFILTRHHVFEFR
jgi:hypothetical protein